MLVPAVVLAVAGVPLLAPGWAGLARLGFSSRLARRLGQDHHIVLIDLMGHLLARQLITFEMVSSQ